MDDIDIRDLEDSNRDLSDKEQEYEKKLRPLDFKDFKGQEKVVENLFQHWICNHGQALTFIHHLYTS